MNNLAQLLQQAQKIQGRFRQMQLELENKKVEASSGGGMVRAVVNGKQELIELNIDPEVLDSRDVEMIEELVCSAVNKALQESRKIMGEEMTKITGGINLPGFLSSLLGS